MEYLNVNWLAILGATISAMVIGFLWYSPILFGKEWMELSKFKKGDIDQSKKGMTRTYSVTMIGAFVTAYVLKLLMDLIYVTTVFEGMQLAFWIWLGFVATTMMTTVLYDKKPWALYLINSGYQLANLLAMAAILSYWI